MVDEFVFWLKSISDDNPIPDEIDCIVFIVKAKGKYAYLELNGYEGKPDFYKICYRPLEAQFFHSKNFNNISTKILNYRIKNLIEDAFVNKEIIKVFKKVINNEIHNYFAGSISLFNIFHIMNISID